ncbi:MAG: DNA topoisomerase I [archaeon]
MNIIISEKPIAGRRIANILSGGEFSETNNNGVPIFNFKYNDKDCLLIPLKGHINRVDFAGENNYWSIYGLNELADKNFVYLPSEYNIVQILRQNYKDLEELIIATDADREGEAIGVEAYNYISEKNKNFKISRSYFSALIDKDVLEAFSNLKTLDFNYAQSVFTRQEIDLLWGAIITRYLSVISNRKGKYFLSAGRVQTPLLNFIVLRELERNRFKAEKYNVISILFEKDKNIFEALYKDSKIFDLENAKKVYEKISSAKNGIVKNIIQKEKILTRPCPFNTTEFLRAASSIGINTSEAMNVAENLYQKGFISYPRTDNTVYPQSLDYKKILNDFSVDEKYRKEIKKILTREINPSFGAKKTTDHPPIHPVTYTNKLIGKEEKVYELIVRRFLATLSTDAKTLNLSVSFDVNGEEFNATGQQIIELGWKEIYFYSKLNEVLLPSLKIGEEIKINDKKIEDKETTPPNHYSEGALIKLMEDENLGTKSTRPEIIKKLKDRGYISGTKNVSANNIAITVCSVLNKHCELITKPQLTANTEIQMDEIAAGKKKKDEVVLQTRIDLKKIIAILINEKDDISKEIKSALANDSVIGKCNLCSKNLVIRYSKNSKQFIGCSNYPSCKNTFPLPQNKKIEITDKVCEVCSLPIIKILNGKRSFEMCINHKCKTKEDYQKKVAEAKEQKEIKNAQKEATKLEKDKIKAEKTKLKLEDAAIKKDSKLKTKTKTKIINATKEKDESMPIIKTKKTNSKKGKI